jgi:hypothetical protein
MFVPGFDTAKPLVDSSEADDRAMSLALASLSRAERADMLTAMGYATARLEARLLPLAEDLGDGDPVEELEAAIAQYMPVLNAARAFDASHWQSSDLDIVVRAECPASLAHGETCISLWDTHDDVANVALAGRARFLAWAAAYTRVVDVGSPDAAQKCAEALRERRRSEGSSIALVLTNDDLALRGVPERDDLQRAARKLGTVGEPLNGAGQPARCGDGVEQRSEIGHREASQVMWVRLRSRRRCRRPWRELGGSGESPGTALRLDARSLREIVHFDVGLGKAEAPRYRVRGRARARVSRPPPRRQLG